MKWNKLSSYLESHLGFDIQTISSISSCQQQIPLGAYLQSCYAPPPTPPRDSISFVNFSSFLWVNSRLMILLSQGELYSCILTDQHSHDWPTKTSICGRNIVIEKYTKTYTFIWHPIGFTIIFSLVFINVIY